MYVLLVEDDAAIREVMSDSLKDAGFDVVEADDGVAAVNILRQPNHFTILVTDFHMPGGIDGAQVAAAARQTIPDLPVIIVTGRPDIWQSQWRSEFGYRFLRKPYLPSQLVALIRTEIA